MSYSLKHDPGTDCIVLLFDGTVTIESIREAAPLVARMCEETGCRRILNDMSAATINVPFIDVFSSPAIMDESKVPRITKRALIVPPGFDEPLFLETVTRNRGHDLMVFYDAEEARRWLFGDS